jgi:cytochrome c6
MKARNPKHYLAATICALLSARAFTQTPEPAPFPPAQVKRGAEIFAMYCTACHGERMSNPELFNLKEFPRDQRARFLNSVANGKNQMPAWRGQITPEEIEALWTNVATGQK